MKRLGLLMAMFGFFMVSAVDATPIDSVELGDHKIELISKNVFDGEFYVWTYKVTSGESPALSHWVLDFCIEFLDHVSDGEDTADHFTNADPTTGFFGLKFDTEYDDNEMREIKLYLTKEVVAVESFVGTKAGRDVIDSGTILAPSCECEEEEIPEPATMALIGAGIVGLTARRRRFI